MKHSKKTIGFFLAFLVFSLPFAVRAQLDDKRGNLLVSGSPVEDFFRFGDEFAYPPSDPLQQQPAEPSEIPGNGTPLPQPVQPGREPTNPDPPYPAPENRPLNLPPFNDDPNPYQAEDLLKKDPPSFFRMDFFGLEAFYEVGNVNNLLDTIRDVRDNLATNAAFNFRTIEDVFAETARLAGILEKDGRGTLEIGANLLNPLAWQQPEGREIEFELNARAGANVFFDGGDNPIEVDVIDPAFNDCRSLLSDPTSVVLLQNCFNAINNSLELRECLNGAVSIEALQNCNIYRVDSDSSATAKGFTGGKFSLKYADRLKDFRTGASEWTRGSLYYGFKFDYLGLTLYETKFAFDNLKINDSLEQRLRDSEKTASVLNLDGRLDWVTSKYSVHLNVRHLNSPTVDYPVDSVGLKTKPSLAVSFYRLFGEEKRNFTFNFYQDLVDEITLTGTENRWRVFSLSYTPETSWLPGFRLGKRYNLTGAELDYNQLGLTMGFFELNVAMSGKTIEIDGQTYPRSMFVNLGFFYEAI